jgi:hypothetical protein
MTDLSWRELGRLHWTVEEVFADCTSIIWDYTIHAPSSIPRSNNTWQT